MSNLCSWLQEASEDGLEVNGLERVMPIVMMGQGGHNKGAAEWLATVAAQVLSGKSGTVKDKGRSLQLFARLIDYSEPVSMVESHLHRLLPVLVALVDASTQGKQQQLAAPALGALSALFGRWDGLTAEGRGALLGCCSRLVPVVSAAIQAGVEPQAGLELLHTVVTVIGGPPLRGAIWTIERAAAAAMDGAGTSPDPTTEGANGSGGGGGGEAGGASRVAFFSPQARLAAASLLGALPAAVPPGGIARNSVGQQLDSHEEGGGGGSGPGSGGGLAGWTTGVSRLLLEASFTLAQVWPASSSEHRALDANLAPMLPPPCNDDGNNEGGGGGDDGAPESKKQGLAHNAHPRRQVLKPFALSASDSATSCVGDRSVSNAKRARKQQAQSSAAASSSSSSSSAHLSIGTAAAYALFACERFCLLCHAAGQAFHCLPPHPTQSAAGVPLLAVVLLLEQVASVSPGGGSASAADSLIAREAGAVSALAMRALLPALQLASLKLASTVLASPGCGSGNGSLRRHARRLTSCVLRLGDSSLPPPLPSPSNSPLQGQGQGWGQAPQALTAQGTWSVELALSSVLDLTSVFKASGAVSTQSQGQGESSLLGVLCACVEQLATSCGGQAALTLLARPLLLRLVHGISFALTVGLHPLNRFSAASGPAPNLGGGGGGSGSSGGGKRKGGGGGGKYAKNQPTQPQEATAYATASGSGGLSGGVSSSGQVVEGEWRSDGCLKSASEVQLIASAASSLCRCLETLAHSCGPLWLAQERALVEACVSVGLDQLARFANSPLRRTPVLTAAQASLFAGQAPSSSSGGLSGGGMGGLSGAQGGAYSDGCGLGACLRGSRGGGQAGEAFKGNLLKLGTALVLSPRGDGGGSGLGILLGEAARAVLLSQGGQTVGHGVGSSAFGSACEAAVLAARVVEAVVMHPRLQPLAAPHFWPTTQAQAQSDASSSQGSRVHSFHQAEVKRAAAALEAEGSGSQGLVQAQLASDDEDDDDDDEDEEEASSARSAEKQQGKKKKKKKKNKGSAAAGDPRMQDDGHDEEGEEEGGGGEEDKQREAREKEKVVKNRASAGKSKAEKKGVQKGETTASVGSHKEVCREGEEVAFSGAAAKEGRSRIGSRAKTDLRSRATQQEEEEEEEEEVGAAPARKEQREENAENEEEEGGESDDDDAASDDDDDDLPDIVDSGAEDSDVDDA